MAGTQNADRLRLELTRRAVLRFGGAGLGYGALSALLAACGGGGTPAEPTPPASSPAPTPTPTPTTVLPPPSQAYVVAKRTSFGVHASTLAQIEAIGIDAWLESQLDWQTIDDSAVEQRVASKFPLSMAHPTTLRAGFPDNIAPIIQQTVAAALYRALFSQRQLYELMVEFWSNHFNIQLANGIEPVLKPYDDMTVIRPHALGRFRDLLQASAKSPAMLYYLDNFLNFKDAPQENYARELLELHTLGVDGGYTEDDVKEVARCFTGWTLNFNTGLFTFLADQHDDGGKTVLGVSIAAGGGIGDGEQVLDILASHPSTARFIASKLCRRFLGDAPASAAVDAVAATFTATDGDIVSMLRTLFARPEFLAADTKFARPLEFVGQMVRSLDPGLSFPVDAGQLYTILVTLLGQQPYNWAPPNGYPDVAGYWATTSGFLNRWRIALYAAYGGFFDLSALAGDADTLNSVTDRMAQVVLHRELDEDDRQTLIDWLVTVTGSAADTPLSRELRLAVIQGVTAILVSSIYLQLR